MSVELVWIKTGICHSVCEEVSRGPLGNTTSQTSLASNVTKELVMGSCIMERVKRLSANDIELGMEIPAIESRASNIPKDKGNNIHDELNP